MSGCPIAFTRCNRFWFSHQKWAEICSTKVLFLRFCQSEKLHSVLDSLDYNLIFVDVLNKVQENVDAAEKQKKPGQRIWERWRKS